MKKIIFLHLIFFSLFSKETIYTVKTFPELTNVLGLDQNLIQMHLKLYEGYVNNTNALLDKLNSTDPKIYEYGALKRRLGWEFDGMRLHELYFEELSGKGVFDEKSKIIKALSQQFGSFENWKKDFKATGLIRGIGWVILYYDTNSNLFINEWINEHETGHLATASPLLIMDVWEHAYISQFGLDRSKYIDIFFQNLNWKLVEDRFNNLKEAKDE